ncbi:MAG: NAD-dependent protein deacylase [alpha proteobacterium MED-G10]|nr:MAG: NAD-dependent protein deacylase [alpha proteobacterium MED-G10]|tara:strand:+ start:508 stop:1215 length:708 start_codon:yes stop_codon:yes gene_type:complete
MNTKKNLFILTGAGVSKESGIKTFREKDGLWENYKIEDVCTVEAFIKDPNLVNNFYNERRSSIIDQKILPNEAHYQLAKLEKKWKGDFILVTQNIDNLHEQAGSIKILHMHGSLDKCFCMNCGAEYKFNFDLSTEFVCKKCNVKGKVRVDIVWFGEQPKYLDKIYKYLDRTDVFLSIGTSNNVYPAAGFIDYLKHQKRKIDFYEFNIEKTSKSFLFTKSFIGPASETLKKLVDST